MGKQLRACPSPETMAKNIRRAVNALTPDQRTAAVYWYKDAQSFVTEEARTRNLHPDVVAGVVAALSPRIRWSTNKKVAQQFLATRTKPSGVMEASFLKAQRILDGGPESDIGKILGGPKTTAFWHALAGHENLTAVVDSWATRVATGYINKEHPGRFYDRIADAYKLAAKEFGLPVNVVQAMAWVYIRGSAQ